MILGAPPLLEKLGLDDLELKRIRKLIHKTHGIIFVTGPTGSGKTTTLYAALDEINSPKRNIITIENPIEYHLPGISQTEFRFSLKSRQHVDNFCR